MTLLSCLVSAAFAEPLVAVVIVDEEARENGYALEIDGWLVDDALPVDVARGEVLHLVDPQGRTEALDLEPGEAWEVTGPQGEAWMSLLDDEIRTDLIAVRGSRPAIDALADSLGAGIVVEDDTIYLSGADILLDAGWVDDELALSVDEVQFVRVRPARDDASDRPVARTRPVGIATTARVREGRGTQVDPAPTPAPEREAATSPPDSSPVTWEKPVRRPAPPPKRPPPGMATGERALEAYSGRHMCRGEMLWLHPDGTYGFRGAVGYWQVVSPGVARLESLEGEVWWRAAIEPDTGFCRDVWSPKGAY